MGSFFVPCGLQHSATFLSLEALADERHALDLTVDDVVHLAGGCRPHRILRMEEAIERTLTGVDDGTGLAAEIALLADRLAAVVQRYQQRAETFPQEAPFRRAYSEAADAVDRMAGWFEIGDDGELHQGLSDLEAAERSIQQLLN